MGSSSIGAIVEGADYLEDMEMNKRMQRRVRVDYEDSDWDPKYCSFLRDLEKYCEARFVVVEEEAEEEEEDEDDPNYVMFLESLKEHGIAYMVDVSREHGVYSPVIYHEGETSSADVVRGTRRTCQGTSSREESRSDFDRRSKSGFEEYSFMPKADAGLHNMRETSPSDVMRGTRRTRQGSRIQEESRSDVDRRSKSGFEDYGFVSKDGDAGLHSVRKRTLRSHQATYNGREGSSDADRNFNSNRKRRGFEPTEYIDASSRRRRKPRCSASTQEEQGLNVNKELKSGKSSLRNTGPVNFIEIDSPDAISRESPISRQGASIHKNGSLDVEREVTQEKPENGSDENYQSYLDAIKNTGHSLICDFGDHRRLLYESYEQIPTDAATSTAEAAPGPFTEGCTKATTEVAPKPIKKVCRKPTTEAAPKPITEARTRPTAEATSKLITEACSKPNTKPTSQSINETMPTPLSVMPISSVPLSARSTAPTSTSGRSIAPAKNTKWKALDVTFQNTGKDFREIHASFFRELDDCLRKPYNQEEYERLWKTFSSRTPIQIHRESRTGGSYREGPLGDSYFIKFPDLYQEIEKVQSDENKVLNLMRMLQYYLVKLARGNIPKPWLDDHSKMILPGSS